MKITIDLDIEASEIPLATELLNTLRSLTEYIRVRQKQENGPVPNGATHHDESHSAPQTAAPAPAPPSQAAPAVAATPEESRDAEHAQRQTALANYIRNASNSYETVASNLENALASADPEVEKLFIGAFSDVVLDPKYLTSQDENLQAEHNMYMNLLGELSAGIKERISQKLVSALMKDMMGKRTGSRTALMLPAMVYAHLVSLEIVNIRGTLKMVEKFLTNAGSEAVGLTMLGKTAEICIHKVLQHASPAHLTSLTAALDGLGSRYAYDVDYLNGFIKWRDPCFRVLTSRQKVHNQAISALAYDPEGRQLISASKDGVVIVWDEWANPVQRHQLTNCYAIAMAILGDQREVVIAGQPIPGQKGPACIAAIGLDQPHQLKGPWVRQRTTTMTSITVLPEQAHFAIGELHTRPGEGGPSPATVVYESTCLQQPASTDLQPAATLSSQGAVMCLTGYGNSKQVVLTGTRSGLVSLWAIQNPSAPVKQFAMPANAGAILCLATDGIDTILAGTNNNMVIMWSMRAMAGIGKTDPLPFVQTLNLDKYPVLKIHFWPNKGHGSQAAVITAHGCWNVNFSTPKPEVQHVQDVDDSDDCSYSAAAWAGEYPYLYTGGASQKVYVCQLVPAQ